MAGHSKFKNIQFRKGAQDKKRSKLFSKLAREITAAAKLGMPDPAANARLRGAIQTARAQNMPKENIDRAIKKSQEAGGADYIEMRYEGFGVGGVGVIVEALTDNRNRTAGDVRAIFAKHGGNLGETGSVSFMFGRVGEIDYDSSAGSPDTMLEAAIDAGATDCMSDNDGHWLTCDAEALHQVAGELENKFGAARSARIVWRPNTNIQVDDDSGETILRMIDALEDNDDVQSVYANFDVSEEVVERMSA